jgi:hypothetical protein
MFALDGVGNHRLRETTGLIKLFPHQDAMPKSTLNAAVSWLTFSVSTGVLGKRKLDDDDDVFGFFTAGVSTHGSTNRVSTVMPPWWRTLPCAMDGVRMSATSGLKNLADKSQ